MHGQRRLWVEGAGVSFSKSNLLYLTGELLDDFVSTSAADMESLKLWPFPK